MTTIHTAAPYGADAGEISDDARHINARDRPYSPGEIAVGVVIGRASEYFDFFVYAIASVLVFPSVFFPFVDQPDRHAVCVRDLFACLHRPADRHRGLHGDPAPLRPRASS